MASTPNNIKRLSGHLLRQGDYLYSRTGKKVSGTGTINQHGSIEECLSLYKKELLNPNGMRFTSIVPIHEDQSIGNEIPLVDGAIVHQGNDTVSSATKQTAPIVIELNYAIPDANQVASAPNLIPSIAVDAYADIPALMQQARRWLVWKYESGPTKKPRKVPYYVNGKRRGVGIALDAPEDIAQLATFEHALQAKKNGSYAGLGFALGPDGTGNYWQGVDLDALPAHPELKHIVDDLPGYTETSPSGNGIHAIGYGKAFASLGSNGTGIEAYSAGRYFTVTGHCAGRNPIVCIATFVDARLRPAHTIGRKSPKSVGAPIETIDSLTVTHLQSALLFIQADDYETWIKVGHALKKLGDAGRALFLEWSATSDKFDPAEASHKWDSFNGDRTDYRAVFAEAQRRGWINPRSNAAVRSFKDSASSTSDADARTTLGGNSEKWLPVEPDQVEVWTPDRRKPIPTFLTKFPTNRLNDFLRWFNASAEETINTISLCGVIHVALVTVSRGASSNMRNCGAAFILVVAPTGMGKNYSKNSAKALFRVAGIHVEIVGTFHSASGIYSALRISPSAVMHLDEFGDRLKNALQDKGGNMPGAFQYLKEVYSETHGSLERPALSTNTLTRSQIESIRDGTQRVRNPVLNILGLTTPDQLWSAIDNAAVEGGFINRFVAVEIPDERIKKNKKPLFEPPKKLSDHLGAVREALAGVLNLCAPGRRDHGGKTDFVIHDHIYSDPNQPADYTEYPFDAKSIRLLNEFHEEIRARHGRDEFMMSITARWRENAMRLAVALAVFEDPKRKAIPSAITKWCVEFVRFFGERFAQGLLIHAQPLEFYGQRRKAYLEAFRRRPEGTVPSDLGRLTPWRDSRKQLRDEIISDLLESGLIAKVYRERGQRGPRGWCYVAINC